MAIKHGTAGEWARVKGTMSGLAPLLLGCVMIGFSLAFFVFVHYAWGALLIVLSVCVYVAALGYVQERVERSFKGARGEERVSGILESLPDTYHVFNDFVAEGHHVDHVVVGPAGVFSVETKCWRGRITLDENYILQDGKLPSRSPVRQAVEEARNVKNELKRLGWEGDVTPILAFASDNFSALIAKVQGAIIMNANYLKQSFSAEDRVIIPPNELDRLIQLMESHE